MKLYDFVVIGGGSAGYAAARTSADLGMKTAVVEGGVDVGGLCILRGCMPSKALIESANRYLSIKRAEEFGLRASEIGVVPVEIIKRKRRLIGEFADYRREQLASGRFDFIRGHARFESPESLRIESVDGDSQVIASRAFLVATGSKISWPAIPGLAAVDALTSDDALELDSFPESLIVLGAGPVALELTHYFAALGVDVTVVQRGKQLLTGMDSDVASVVENALRERGVRIFTDTSIQEITRDDQGTVTVTFSHHGVEKSVSAGQILNALGRVPNTEGIGLEDIGVQLNRGRIGVNEAMQTTVPTIFAGGDCTGPYEVVHIAITQGEIAARNAKRVLAFESPETLEKTDYRLKLFAVFTDPEAAMVGMGEEEALADGLEIVVAKYPFIDHGKSLVMGETHGFVKLIALRASGEICGGSVVGPHASDLIHEIVVAMAFRATAKQLAQIPHYHPTLGEIWTYPAEEIADQIRD